MIALAVTTCAEFLNELIQTNYNTKADSNNSLNYFFPAVSKRIQQLCFSGRK